MLVIFLILLPPNVNTYMEKANFMCQVSSITCPIYVPASLCCSSHCIFCAYVFCRNSLCGYVAMYEPVMPISFAVLCVEILLSSVQEPWVECFCCLDTVVGRALPCGVFETVYSNADSLSYLKSALKKLKFYRKILKYSALKWLLSYVKKEGLPSAPCIIIY